MEKLETTHNKSILLRIINFSKKLCIQAIIILIITLIYIKYNSSNYSDTLLFFSYGLFISIFLIATVVLIYKKDFIINKYINKFEKQKQLPFILEYLKTITKNNNKIIITYYLIYTIGWHILFLLMALYYVNSYINDSKKTKNDLQNKFDTIKSNVENDFKELINKKEFAEKIKDNPNRSFLFKRLDSYSNQLNEMIWDSIYPTYSKPFKKDEN